MVFQIRSNPLIYPAGRTAGLNPQHVAVKGGTTTISNPSYPWVSAVAQGNNFVDLRTARTGAVSGSPTAVLNPFLGPAVNFGAVPNIQFSTTGGTLATPPAVTMAGIFQFDSLSGSYQCIVEDVTLYALLAINANKFIFYNQADKTSNISASANVPYFVAASGQPPNYNFIVKNLRTGEIQVASLSSAGAFGVMGVNFRIGNNSGQGALGSIAATMMSYVFLSPNDLISWAQDPWAFWYPRWGIAMTGIAAAAAAGGAFSVIQDSAQGSVEMIGY